MNKIFYKKSRKLYYLLFGQRGSEHLKNIFQKFKQFIKQNIGVLLSSLSIILQNFDII